MILIPFLIISLLTLNIPFFPSMLLDSSFSPSTLPNETVTENVYKSDINFSNSSDTSTEITVSFAGDCTLGTDEKFPYIGSFPEQFKKQQNPYTYFFSGVESIFKNDDITLVNLENTFTTSTKRAEKKFCFKSEPSYAKILKEGNIEVVNIANNHIYDYGKSGFDETLEALDSMDILYCGEGHTTYYEVKGIKIAFLGYRGFTSDIAHTVRKDLKIVKQHADIVIVSFHWGIERSFYPNKIQLELGRMSIDEGADIVIGHHPHVIQGIDHYKGKYIVYSLGNFCFGGNFNPQDKDTFIFQCRFTLQDGKIVKNEGTIIPCSISSVEHRNDYKPTILEGKNKDRVLDRIYTYSQKLKYGIRKDK